jgi:Uma2 family endonuclease
MTATTTLMTADELERMPEDEYRYDLIRGVLKQMSPTGFRHLKVAGTAIWLLSEYVVPRGLGGVGGEGGFVLELDPDTVLAPDVAFVRTERLPPEDQWDRFARLAPDLVMEIVSPSDTRADVEEKVGLYLAAGVPLVLVVDPRRRTVRVRTPDGGDRLLTETDELDGGTVLPGFRVPVARIFA